jgi:hypothetical protein
MAAGVTLASAMCGSACAVEQSGEYVDLSLEELANLQITFVSRRAESLADVPAAVFVIANEDIRRSGAAIDLRFGWKLRRDLALSVIGQNLPDSRHSEFGAPATSPECERSIFGKLVWRS